MNLKLGGCVEGLFGGEIKFFHLPRYTVLSLSLSGRESVKPLFLNLTRGFKKRRGKGEKWGLRVKESKTGYLFLLAYIYIDKVGKSWSSVCVCLKSVGERERE